MVYIGQCRPSTSSRSPLGFDSSAFPAFSTLATRSRRRRRSLVVMGGGMGMAAIATASLFNPFATLELEYGQSNGAEWTQEIKDSGHVGMTYLKEFRRDLAKFGSFSSFLTDALEHEVQEREMKNNKCVDPSLKYFRSNCNYAQFFEERTNYYKKKVVVDSGMKRSVIECNDLEKLHELWKHSDAIGLLSPNKDVEVLLYVDDKLTEWNRYGWSHPLNYSVISKVMTKTDGNNYKILHITEKASPCWEGDRKKVVRLLCYSIRDAKEVVDKLNIAYVSGKVGHACVIAEDPGCLGEEGGCKGVCCHPEACNLTPVEDSVCELTRWSSPLDCRLTNVDDPDELLCTLGKSNVEAFEVRKNKDCLVKFVDEAARERAFAHWLGLASSSKRVCAPGAMFLSCSEPTDTNGPASCSSLLGSASNFPTSSIPTTPSPSSSSTIPIQTKMPYSVPSSSGPQSSTIG